ncbi:ATP-grasp fold amidoligase family protein [Methylobacterium sp. CM6257]
MNDYFFYRMISNKWSALEISSSDKEHAKIIAKGLEPRVLTPKNEDVIELYGLTSAEDLRLRLTRHFGAPVIAKPTHNSGGITFLEESPTISKIRLLYDSATKNYFQAFRETQYAKLTRKIIVEECLNFEGRSPPDYKFFCCRGRVLFCQIDLDRFLNHKRALVSVPDFRPMNIEYKYPIPDQILRKPLEFERMVEFSSNLSQPFDFVRIDLYPIQGKIYFGEFTFTPEASAGRFSDERFSIEVLSEIKSILAAAGSALLPRS